MAAPNLQRAAQQPSPRPRPTGLPAESLPLSELGAGRGGVVTAVATDGPEADRLLDLGFVPGTRVDVLGRAPLGDPTAYRLRGTSLCLRRSEARRVAIRPD